MNKTIAQQQLAFVLEQQISEAKGFAYPLSKQAAQQLRIALTTSNPKPAKVTSDHLLVLDLLQDWGDLSANAEKVGGWWTIDLKPVCWLSAELNNKTIAVFWTPDYWQVFSDAWWLCKSIDEVMDVLWSLVVQQDAAWSEAKGDKQEAAWSEAKVDKQEADQADEPVVTTLQLEIANDQLFIWSGAEIAGLREVLQQAPWIHAIQSANDDLYASLGKDRPDDEQIIETIIEAVEQLGQEITVMEALLQFVSDQWFHEDNVGLLDRIYDTDWLLQTATTDAWHISRALFAIAIEQLQLDLQTAWWQSNLDADVMSSWSDMLGKLVVLSVKENMAMPAIAAVNIPKTKLVQAIELFVDWLDEWGEDLPDDVIEPVDDYDLDDEQ